MKKQIRRFVHGLRNRSAQSLAEYALILAVVSMVAMLVFKGNGKSVDAKLTSVNGNLQ